MRKLILYIACSLDGKIARPDGSIDWLPSPTEQDYGYREFYDSIDTVIMGYKTYEICLGFGEWHFKDKQSYVFSRDYSKIVITEAQLVTEAVPAFVEKLKAAPGKDIWLLGGGEIVSLLHDAGLINEYILAYVPLILGTGIPLFPNIQKQQNLKLKKHLVYDNGLSMLYFETEKG